MRYQKLGYILDIDLIRRDTFTEAEYWATCPTQPIGEVLYCEATLTDDTGWPILRTCGPTPVAAVLKMEWLLEEKKLTGPLKFIGELLDECSPRRSLHHGERSSEQQ